MEKQSESYVIVLPTMNEEEEEDDDDDDDDLSRWEFIHSSDSDSGFDADDVLSFRDVSLRRKVVPFPFASPTGAKFFPIHDPIQNGDDGDHHHRVDQEPYIGDQEEEEEDDDDDDDDDGYGCDLDDELVPRTLSGKFGRQRMRKLGKRAFAKMNTSKKSPVLYVKPGCVHGKHGLGLKHSF